MHFHNPYNRIKINSFQICRNIIQLENEKYSFRQTHLAINLSDNKTQIITGLQLVY